MIALAVVYQRSFALWVTAGNVSRISEGCERQRGRATGASQAASFLAVPRFDFAS